MGSPHRYIPNTEQDVASMLSDIGVSSIDDLFAPIPDELKFKGALNLPKAMSEPELLDELSCLAAQNASAGRYASFLGGGIYNHYVPSAVDHIISRSEFYTAYTPYQAEVSQGTLQAIFEFQTMIAELTAMDVANASMYDAGTAVAEAASVAVASTRKKKVVVTRATNPSYREVLKTYALPKGIEVIEVDYDAETGTTDTAVLEACVDTDTACVIAQSPNYFGCIEDMASFGTKVHSLKGLFVAVVDPVSLALLTPPGEYEADIAVGEAQSLGNCTNFGGPLLGFFAAKSALVRKLPGRLVGQTTDKSGKRGFVLTLQTREQHIRREGATSNICSNEALCALAATVYLSLMGPHGLKKVAELCVQKAHYLANELSKLPGFKLAFTGSFFNEFALKTPICSKKVNDHLFKSRIIGGKRLKDAYTELSKTSLWAVTETNTRAQLDRLVAELEGLE